MGRLLRLERAGPSESTPMPVDRTRWLAGRTEMVGPDEAAGEVTPEATGRYGCRLRDGGMGRVTEKEVVVLSEEEGWACS